MSVLDDNAVFYDPASPFAVAVTLYPGQDRERVIYGIYDDPHQEAEVDAEVPIYQDRPTLTCAASDVADLAQDDPLQVDDTDYLLAADPRIYGMDAVLELIEP